MPNKFYRKLAYRDALIRTANTIENLKRYLADRLFEVTMTGEMKKWADSVPSGEIHTISYDLYEACEDVNIKLLLRLIRFADYIGETMQEINIISKEDMDFFEPDLSDDDENVEPEDGQINDLPF